MIVADTNLISYLLIEGDHTAASRAVWQRDADWHMPPLWRSEFLNVLATSVRAAVLTDGQATAVWDIASLLFGRSEHEPVGRSPGDRCPLWLERLRRSLRGAGRAPGSSAGDR